MLRVLMAAAISCCVFLSTVRSEGAFGRESFGQNDRRIDGVARLVGHG